MLTLNSGSLSSLETAADNAINNALSGKVTGWPGKPPASEPDAVAAVVSAGFPNVAKHWSPILSPLGYRVDVTGIFCHSTPMVDFTSATLGTKRCELADLLIVMDEISLGTVVNDRRAVLVQAKIAQWPRKSLSGSDLVQLDLYQNWPIFVVSGSKTSCNLKAPSCPGHVDEGRDYGVIDLPTSPVRWQQISPINPLIMASGQSIGQASAQMLTGSYGREAFPSGGDPWSDLVDELLTTTYIAAAGGYSGSPKRGVTTTAFIVAEPDYFGIGLSFHNPILPPSQRDDRELPPGPVSIVHIRVTRSEG